VIFLAVVLLALGVGDWVACGLGGEPLGRRRAVSGVIVAGVVGLTASWLLAPSGITAATLCGLAVTGSAACSGLAGSGVAIHGGAPGLR
jgi:hypothetical protein